ncbi:MAG: winged helix-turn-helix transcriptional regulator [Clostridiales bacterium]|nr:winged helix-turn-helix transcriptional regulator [Clostridiales bacterium]
MFQLQINKQSGEAIHRQIAGQICRMIDSGAIRGGDKLPTERTIAETCDVARGTVNAAYTLLARMGKIVSVQGSGAYVLRVHSDIAQRFVRDDIGALLEAAVEMGVDEGQVEALLRQEVERRRHVNSSIRLAWVGCTREVLRYAQKTIEEIPMVRSTGFLISEIEKDPALLDDNFDLIVTTEMPYEALKRAVPLQADKIEKITLSMDMKSVIDLCGIQPEAKVIFWGLDGLFVQIMEEEFGMFPNLHGAGFFTGEDAPIREALDMCDVLVLPSRGVVADQPNFLKAIATIQRRGKRALYVHYHVDRGSQIHLESQVQLRWMERNRNGLVESAYDKREASRPSRREKFI